jgi:pyruvate dehydrogenase E2 component (dihydrolipoamide acetyltransferase)
VELGGAESETLTVGSVLVRIATAAAETAGRAGNSAEEPVALPQSANGSVRKPVLVGYGADDEMDTSRRGLVGQRPRAQPPVRKLAAELNVDLSRVTGSGPDGVITREDVLAAAGRTAPTPEMVAVRGVHAEMAHRMTLSRRRIPDAHAGVRVDCSGLLQLRDRMRGITDDESPITPFVLTLRLLTIALRHHPKLNSTWLDTTDGACRQRDCADVGCGGSVRRPRWHLEPSFRRCLPRRGTACAVADPAGGEVVRENGRGFGLP